MNGTAVKTNLVKSATYLHSECFTTPCLAITKDCSIEAIQNSCSKWKQRELPSTTGFATSLKTSYYLTRGPNTLSKPNECVPAMSLDFVSPPHYNHVTLPPETYCHWYVCVIISNALIVVAFLLQLVFWSYTTNYFDPFSLRHFLYFNT